MGPPIPQQFSGRRLRPKQAYRGAMPLSVLASIHPRVERLLTAAEDVGDVAKKKLTGRDRLPEAARQCAVELSDLLGRIFLSLRCGCQKPAFAAGDGLLRHRRHCRQQSHGKQEPHPEPGHRSSAAAHPEPFPACDHAFPATAAVSGSCRASGPAATIAGTGPCAGEDAASAANTAGGRGRLLGRYRAIKPSIKSAPE